MGLRLSVVAASLEMDVEFVKSSSALLAGRFELMTVSDLLSPLTSDIDERIT